MHKFTIITFTLLAVPCVAHANPVVINPSSLIAFWVVVFFALVVEAGISALIVTLSGMSPARIFFAFLTANAAVYFLGFRPLLEAGKFPLMILECAVVGVDAAAILLFSQFEFFQSQNFVKLSWFQAMLAASGGNAFSYFIGRVASNPY